VKIASIVGIVLIVLGVLSLGYEGVLWVSGTEQVAKVGPLEVNRTRDFPIPLAPIIAGALVAGGVILLIAGARRTSG
jgi:hypothetical protein